MEDEKHFEGFVNFEGGGRRWERIRRARFCLELRQPMAGLGNEINDWYNGGNALKGTGHKSQTFGSNNYLNNNCI